MMARHMIRHGDILIEEVSRPSQEALEGAIERKSGVVAQGEATGHAHRIIGDGRVLDVTGATYIAVGSEGAQIVHDEHRALHLLPDRYYVAIQQIEYDPYEHAARQVMD